MSESDTEDTYSLIKMEIKPGGINLIIRVFYDLLLSENMVLV